MPRKSLLSTVINLMHSNATDRNHAKAAYGMGLCTFEEMTAELKRLDSIMQTLQAEHERETKEDAVRFDYFGLFCDNPWSNINLRNN